MRFKRQMAKYTGKEYKRTKDMLKDLNSEFIVDKIINMKSTALKMLTEHKSRTSNTKISQPT
jgi:site-specific recombinase XerC